MPIKKLLILALIVGAGYYVFGVKGFNPFAKKIRGDIQLYTLDGQQKTLDDYAGENGTFIFYMATWCPHCAEEAAYLKGLDEFFKLHKIGIVICMTGSDNDEIHSWVYKNDIPWNWRTVYWQDPLYDEFHMKKSSVPYLTVRDRDSKIVFSNSGAFYSNTLTEIATNMLKSYK